MSKDGGCWPLADYDRGGENSKVLDAFLKDLGVRNQVSVEVSI